MNDMVDLTVTSIANDLYALIDRVSAEPAADKVSRGDWLAIHLAAYDLLEVVRDKLTSAVSKR